MFSGKGKDEGIVNGGYLVIWSAFAEQEEGGDEEADAGGEEGEGGGPDDGVGEADDRCVAFVVVEGDDDGGKEAGDAQEEEEYPGEGLGAMEG